MGLLNRVTTNESDPKKGGLLQRAKKYLQGGTLRRPADPKKKPNPRP